MKFLLSAQAQQTINEIWDFYFSRGGTALADRIVADLREAIDRLIEQPSLGHLRPA